MRVTWEQLAERFRREMLFELRQNQWKGDGGNDPVVHVLEAIYHAVKLLYAIVLDDEDAQLEFAADVGNHAALAVRDLLTAEPPDREQRVYAQGFMMLRLIKEALGIGWVEHEDEWPTLEGEWVDELARTIFDAGYGGVPPSPDDDEPT